MAWEPDALDGSDALFAGQKETGSDDNGRFMPWWYRDAQRNLVLEPVGVQLPPREAVQDEPEKPARAAKGPRK